MRVAFVHPDLGLGGAERFIVDAALSLKDLGHDPAIFSPFQDASRCFEEVHPENPLVKVHVVPSVVPRSIFGRFQAILAAIRCSLLALYVCVFHKFDVAVVDIVSLPILVFALFRKPVLFYCHYPDKLLATTLCPGSNQSPLKRAYRIAVDGLEALSLGFSSAICCNSRFTCRAFASTFPTLRRPNVIYPCVNIPDVNTPELRRPARLLVSLNRYERKKNIALAIETLGTLVEQRGHEVDDLKLIIAGGYDSRLQENVEHFEELERLVADRGLAERVTLRRNVSNEERRNMLRSALAILYTPSNEHFGIVPLEAMAEGIPVVAVNNGGPVESIENNVSGVLCESSADAFAQALGPFLENQQSSITMGLRGRERVQKYFSRAVLGSELQNALVRLVIP